jgi:pyridoxal phosphate enzyme (YggS family)
MITDNILKLKEKIDNLCAKLNRDKIRLVAVTKTVPVELIIEAINSGITEIGENRVQEAEKKFSNLNVSSNIIKHFIGHLQTNKVKKAVSLFDLIQSVDSIHLAQEIDKQAKKINKIQNCLIEVKISEEKTKFGYNPDKISELVSNLLELKNIKLCGLMTIAPYFDNPENTRPYFKQMKKIFDKIRDEFKVLSSDFNILSMGMTDDFYIAIEEGANMVRIGRAIFGERT